MSTPPNKLPDANEREIKPPVGGRLPVSLSVALNSAKVALTEIARPLKVVAPPGVGFGVGVATGVGVGVEFGVGVGDATGVGVGLANGVGVGVTVPHRTRIKMA